MRQRRQHSEWLRSRHSDYRPRSRSQSLRWYRHRPIEQPNPGSKPLGIPRRLCFSRSRPWSRLESRILRSQPGPRPFGRRRTRSIRRPGRWLGTRWFWGRADHERIISSHECHARLVSFSHPTKSIDDVLLRNPSRPGSHNYSKSISIDYHSLHHLDHHILPHRPRRCSNLSHRRSLHDLAINKRSSDEH
jgi:hypothetical protein